MDRNGKEVPVGIGLGRMAPVGRGGHTPAPRATLSPADGQQDVLPDQVVEVRFDEPVFLRPDAVDLTDAIVVKNAGTAVAGRWVLDGTGTRLTFIPEQDLAGGTEFDAAFDGSQFTDRAGNVVAPGK
jgi:hypothetical protein